MGLVIGILISATLDRQSAQRLAVERQLRAYQDDHLGKGIQALIEAWVAAVRNRPLIERVEQDGRVLEATLAGGVVMTLYAFDGQGEALAQFQGLNGQALTDAVGVLRELRRADLRRLAPTDPRTGRRLPLERQRGPLAISVNAASEPVLRAVLRYATQGGGDGYVEKVLAARTSGGQVSPTDHAQFMTEAKLTPEQQNTLSRLFVFEPILWRLEAMVKRDSPDPLQVQRAYYGGLAIINRQSRSSLETGSDGFQRYNAVLTWERIGE
ncbi:MAG: hypothetical protein SFZ23_00985 [Planctomycetota bacterium]|nr:hypothetical protein [Planctomycetota bacterium]